MKPVRRTALQGEAIGDGEAIQVLGKGLDRSRKGGIRTGEPRMVRASTNGRGSLRRMPQPRRGGNVRRTPKEPADSTGIRVEMV